MRETLRAIGRARRRGGHGDAEDARRAPPRPLPLHPRRHDAPRADRRGPGAASTPSRWRRRRGRRDLRRATHRRRARPHEVLGEREAGGFLLAAAARMPSGARSRCRRSTGSSSASASRSSIREHVSSGSGRARAPDGGGGVRPPLRHRLARARATAERRGGGGRRGRGGGAGGRARARRLLPRERHRRGRRARSSSSRARRATRSTTSSGSCARCAPPSTHGRELQLSVGVSRGRVFAGEVGAPFRRTYTILGGTAALAARLMAKARPRQILVPAELLERSRRVSRPSRSRRLRSRGSRNRSRKGGGRLASPAGSLSLLGHCVVQFGNRFLNRARLVLRGLDARLNWWSTLEVRPQPNMASRAVNMTAICEGTFIRQLL